MNLIIFLLGIPAIILAVAIHEYTRAAVSTALGDTLPKTEGRLSLNPLKHVDPIGVIVMLATGFGWGQPVSTSALYYKNRKQGTLLTAILPTVANLIAAVVFMLLGKLSGGIYFLSAFFIRVSYYNICLFVYNFAPVTPMDCTKVLSVILPSNMYFKYLQYEKVIQMGFLLLLFMGTFSFLFNPIITGIYRTLMAIFMI